MARSLPLPFASLFCLFISLQITIFFMLCLPHEKPTLQTLVVVERFKECWNDFRRFVVFSHSVFLDGKRIFFWIICTTPKHLRRHGWGWKREMRNLAKENQNHISTLILFEKFHAPNQRRCWNYIYGAGVFIQSSTSLDRREVGSEWRKRKKKELHIFEMIFEKNAKKSGEGVEAGRSWCVVWCGWCG